MKEQLISIIVPIYNVEDYLGKCIESIVCQTYKNIEIILVNDGSTDACGQICDKWEKLDNRIKVIHKENGGLSDARNAGLKNVNGEYIGFVDSDDWIEKDMYEIMLAELVDNKADVAVCAYREFYDDVQNISQNKGGNSFIFGADQFLEQIIRGSTYSVWKYLYKRNIIEKMTFKKGVYYEDVLFTTEVMTKINRIVYIEKALYNYRKRIDSIVGKNLIKKNITDFIWVFRRQQRLLYDTAYLKAAQRYYYKGLLLLKEKVYRQSKDRELLNIIKKEMSRCKIDYREEKMSRIIALFLRRHCMPIYILITDLMGSKLLDYMIYGTTKTKFASKKVYWSKR